MSDFDEPSRKRSKRNERPTGLMDMQLTSKQSSSLADNEEEKNDMIPSSNRPFDYMMSGNGHSTRTQLFSP